MRHALSLVLPALLAACGDLDVRSVRAAPTGVPSALIGEWQGTWQSSATAANGVVVVRVQEFDGEPVVNVQFQNPCLAPRAYDLVVTPATIELRADGQTVLAASLGDGRELVGTYTCSAEAGTWQAQWRRDLPVLLDLGGTWAGTVQFADQLVRPIELRLEQQVEGGEMLLQGELDLGDLWPAPIPVVGTVLFRDQGYDVTLHTPSGANPELLLSGGGTVDPLRIEAGLLHAANQSLPFPLGVFTIQRAGD
jgi:hypothetical protein